MFYSDCCGAEIPLDGVDYGICPTCKEHCEVVEEKEDENVPLNATIGKSSIDGELKDALFSLMDSNSKLGQAEYDRNPTYNDQHFHYKAETKIIKCLQNNYPDVWEEYLKRGY